MSDSVVILVASGSVTSPSARNGYQQDRRLAGFHLRVGADCELVAEQHDGPLSLLVIRRTSTGRTAE